ncbi:glycosyltransferase family 39 protein [Oceanirhabdus sp. W0125-5]|uniref:glycosyltransferase family 39 protein n=1 Tax=Oceanirhabdus sp. W0125-5 TaxID=2999116 RepID=UPI0022F3402C|nr:glycosyltransferase family 39 protein [Oceanirhabdus sp. W0125-5]WBW98861.1 glycosyltransferase family 39 protein [Oceanirhabdus sp. W0125-5]
MKKIDIKSKVIFYGYLSIYLFLNVVTLTKFPFVHSDESWLAGLSRGYSINHTPYVTESFFDLYPRNPHMIKVIFHYLQTLFIKIFGYNIFSVRLISLIAGMITIYLMYIIFNRILKDSMRAALLTILSSLNIQFIYASHFARQEIILLMIMIGCYYIYRFSCLSLTKKVTIIGILVGIAIGFHPNAFILGVVFGMIMLIDFIKKEISYKLLIIYGFIILGFGAIFVGLSFLGDINFINNYSNYGATLNVDATLIDKLFNLDEFYIKLFNQIGGTYYLPNIKMILVSIGIMFIGSLVGIILFKDKFEDKEKIILIDSLIALIAINIALVIIGRYNATSIIFIMPFGYFILGVLIKRIKKRAAITTALLIGMIIFSSIADYKEISIYTHYDYKDYLLSIEQNLQDDSIILGNLSAGFLFEEGTFFDIRNLAYLEENNLTLEEYIKSNNINTIIYYEELDYIHRNEQWTILYGDDNFYYDDLNRFIENHCSLVRSFNHPVYGMRIVRYMHDYPWKIKIYRVNKGTEYVH